MINANSYLVKFFDGDDKLKDAYIECNLMSTLDKYINYMREKKSFRILFTPLNFYDDGYFIEEDDAKDVLLQFDFNEEISSFQSLSGNNEYHRNCVKDALMKSKFKNYIKEIE